MALFYSPGPVTIDVAGNLYVFDMGVWAGYSPVTAALRQTNPAGEVGTLYTVPSRNSNGASLLLACVTGMAAGEQGMFISLAAKTPNMLFQRFARVGAMFRRVWCTR